MPKPRELLPPYLNNVIKGRAIAAEIETLAVGGKQVLRGNAAGHRETARSQNQALH